MGPKASLSIRQSDQASASACVNSSQVISTINADTESSIIVHQLNMTGYMDEIISVENSIGRTYGLFKKGATSARAEKPLVVLIHGGGTNAFYFENHLHS